MVNRCLFHKVGMQLLLLFFLSGCVTVKKEALPPVNMVKPDAAAQKMAPSGGLSRKELDNKLTDDVISFTDLQQIDLNKDGKNEIVALYIAKGDLSGVKVISADDGKCGNVLFRRIFDTKNAKLEIKDGIPVVMFEEFGPSGRLSKKTLVWDGVTFIPKE